MQSKRSKLTSFLLLLSLLLGVHANINEYYSGVCTYFSTDGDFYDLSKLVKEPTERYLESMYKYADEESNIWFFNICGPLYRDPLYKEEEGDRDVTVCLSSSSPLNSDNNNCLSMGYTSTAAWADSTLGPNGGLKITYTGEECPSNPSQRIHTIFELVCSKHNNFFIDSVLFSNKDNCTTHFVIESTEACPKQGPDSDSDSHSDSDSDNDNKNYWPGGGDYGDDEDEHRDRIFPHRRWEKKEFLRGLGYFISMVLTLLVCTSCIFSCVKGSQQQEELEELEEEQSDIIIELDGDDNNNYNNSNNNNITTEHQVHMFQYSSFPIPSAPTPPQLYNHPSILNSSSNSNNNSTGQIDTSLVIPLYPVIQYPPTFQPPQQQ